MITFVALLLWELVHAHASSQLDYSGKCVLVTGGTGGMGYATALKFAQAGAKGVYIVGRNATTGAHAEGSINAAAGRAVARYVQADLYEAEAAFNMVDTVVNTCGALDVAINNAGALPYMSFVADYPEKLDHTRWDGLYIYYSLFNSLRAELRHWKTTAKEGDLSEQGCVVNVGSMQSETPCPGGHSYCAAKYAIRSLSQAAALEHASAGFKPVPLRSDGFPNTAFFNQTLETTWMPKVRINAVLPGLIDTPFTHNQVSEPWHAWQSDRVGKDDPRWLGATESPRLNPFGCSRDGTCAALPNGRMGQPEEIANVHLFLCSEGASYMQGESITVSGGEAAKSGH